MPDNAAYQDVAEVRPETDRPAEALGEIDGARFKPAPAEVRASTEETLSRGFPDPESQSLRR